MANDNNIASARATFEGFVGLMKWGTIGSVITAVIVVLLIS